MENNDLGSIVINGVNTEKGIARFAGKKERYFKNLRGYAETLKEAIPPFDSFITEREAAAGKLHAAKGISGNLEILELFEAIKEFEVSVKKGAPDEALYNKIIVVIENVAEEILEKTAGLNLPR